MKVSVATVLLLALVGSAGTTAAQAKPRFVNPGSLPPSRGYTHLVEVSAGSRMVYISGQVPLDWAGKLVGAGDFRGQVEQVFTNLRLALDEVGASFAQVVKLNYCVVDVSHLAVLRAVRDRYVNLSSPPASTLVEVRRLFRDDVMLEIDAVVALPPP